MSQSSFVCTQLNGYTYDLLVNSLYIILFLNKLELICLHTSIAIVCTQLNGSKYWFQILLTNVNSFICAQLNDFKHRYVTLTIHFKYTVKEFQVLLFNTNNSVQNYSFLST